MTTPTTATPDATPAIKTPHFVIPARDIALDAIARLKYARGQGELSFLFVYWELRPSGDEGSVNIIVSPKRKKSNLAAIGRICNDYAATLQFHIIEAVPDLCLPGEAIDQLYLASAAGALRKLNGQVSEAKPMAALVRPDVWAIAVYDSADGPQLEIGLRLPVPPDQQARAAHELCQLLGWGFLFLVDGQILEVSPTDSIVEIAGRILPTTESVLPAMLADAATQLELLTAKLRAWVPGQLLPGDSLINPQTENGHPTNIIAFGMGNIDVHYHYDPQEEDE